MSTATRIYVVGNIETCKKHLVRASNSAQAARHIIRTSHIVEVASQDQLVELIASGVPVENASTYAEEL
jgi:hypothetical protein